MCEETKKAVLKIMVDFEKEEDLDWIQFDRLRTKIIKELKDEIK